MIYYLRFICGCFLLIVLAGCTANDPLISSEKEATTIRISAAPMIEINELKTRALFPVKPEVENYIHSLAFLVFDEEFSHIIGDDRFYRYLTFENATTTVSLDQADILQRTASYYYVIANIPEKTLLSLLQNIADRGSMISQKTFIEKLKIDIPYIMKQDSVGLVNTTYMSGQHEGKLTESTVNITLGRIITRLNISLSISSGVESLDYGYAIRILNSSRTAYIIPGDSSPKEETVDDPYRYPVELTTTPQTFYYYVGPRSATNEEEATNIEITYGEKNDNGTFDPEATTNQTVNVPLCNTWDSSVPRAFWLNRNSIYNISILLKKREKLPVLLIR